MSPDVPVPPLSNHDLADALIRASGESYRALCALVDLIPAGVLVCDVHAKITIHNAAADEILGGHVMATTLRPGQGYALLSPSGSPLPVSDLPLFRAIRHGETTHDVEILVQREEGTRRTVLASGQPIVDENGQISGAVAIFQDITEREHTVRLLATRERQHEVVAQMGQEALAGVALTRLFDDAVRLISQTLGVEFVKVLELLPDQSKLLLRAGVGWHEGLVGHALVDAGRHSQAGYTLRSAHPVIVNDLSTERRFQGPPLLTDHGVVSGISVIIQGEPQPFGVLGAHTAHKRTFTTDDVNFVQSVANVLAMAIERTRSEDVLRQQAQIIDQIHDAVVATDLQGNVTSWSKGAERILGHVKSEAMGRHISFTYPPDVYPEGARVYMDKQVIAPLLAKGYREVEVTLQRKSGEVFFADLRLSLLHNREGVVTGMIGYAMDITERKQVEAERAKLLHREAALAQIAQALMQERVLSQVVDTIVGQSQGVLGADAVGVWLADPLRREMTMLAYRGKTPSVPDLLHTVSFDTSLLSARAALTGEPQIVTDIASQHQDMPLLHKIAALEGMRSTLSLPLHSGDHLVGVITFAWSVPRQFSDDDLAFDATIADLFAVAIENAHVYDLLRQALRLREEFMATAAHELRTPLTVIKGNAQVLLTAKAQSPGTRRALEAVDRHVDRIAQIVDDLLQSVEVRPGLATLDVQQFDLSALVREVPSTVRELANERTIRVSTDHQLDVKADPKLIAETIKRLLKNALRYSPATGSVEVAAYQRGKEAIVSVTDHGVGIAADRQAHVFEPFFDLVRPGSPGYLGMSDLGLYLSKHIIEAHGGRIWHSNTPGGGSTFAFSLPPASSSGN